MRGAGFAVRDTADDETMTQYARLLFDSDEESERQGYTIPQVRLVWFHANDRSRIAVTILTHALAAVVLYATGIFQVSHGPEPFGGNP